MLMTITRLKQLQTSNNREERRLLVEGRVAELVRLFQSLALFQLLINRTALSMRTGLLDSVLRITDDPNYTIFEIILSSDEIITSLFEGL